MVGPIMVAMSDHELPPDPRPSDDFKGKAIADALSSTFPRLQWLLSVPPCQAGGLLPYLLLAALYHWSSDHKVTAGENDPETQAVIRLCAALFTIPAEEGEPVMAVTAEIAESLLAIRRTGP
jgi:hypothetical protein